MSKEIQQRRLNKRDATRLNKAIKGKIDELEALIVQFIQGQGWLALGYETAFEWWSGEIGERRLGTETAKLAIIQFKEEGVSKKEIASAIGLSPRQVQRVGTSQGETSVSPQSISDLQELPNDLEPAPIPDLGREPDARDGYKADDDKAWHEGILGVIQLVSSMETITKSYPNASSKQRKNVITVIDTLISRLESLRETING